MNQSIVSMLKSVLLGLSLSFCLAGMAEEGRSVKKDTQAQSQKVNINTASLEQLMQLPGVGPAIAQRIIDFRDTHDGYKQVEEILNVKGIGAKTFEKFKDRISI